MSGAAPESTEKEKPGEAKWAAEAFGFLRFFQRVGNQVWGLILLEIGWAFLLVLTSKLTAAGSSPKIPTTYTGLRP